MDGKALENAAIFCIIALQKLRSANRALGIETGGDIFVALGYDKVTFKFAAAQ